MAQHNAQRYEAYNAFLLRHREAVWRVCWKFAKGNRVKCEDMVQEVWITLWLRFDELNENYNEWQQRVWVKRVTRSVIIDLYRRSEPETEQLTPVLIQTMPETTINLAEDIDDLLALLPEDEERMMRMRLEGYDAQEIADEFKMNRNAVYVRINRIITKLRRRHGTGL